MRSCSGRRSSPSGRARSPRDWPRSTRSSGSRWWTRRPNPNPNPTPTPTPNPAPNPNQVDPAVRQQQIEARLAQIDEQLTENTDTAAR